eukprot:CAMPEP_0196667226 /NCGR_PEP_ID=MMETSP1086-20130531/64965_1 /TAXON_ID=77921 /ORGANISM="Cyanoptyche  gloeocystis , Strain SAG4.97" /LENGTH=45 /DNA_ID= /DNA_START= /DNA_END= /DNA_ORIENTATION=
MSEKTQRQVEIQQQLCVLFVSLTSSGRAKGGKTRRAVVYSVSSAR